MWNIIKDNNRHRYIGFVIKSSKENPQFKKADIINGVRTQCNHLFNKGFSDMGLYVVRFNGEKGIVKCNHVEKENTIKLLNSIEKISSYKVNIQTVGTSGTIKSLLRKHMAD